METDYLCIPLIGCLSVLVQFYIGLALVFLSGVVVGCVGFWLVRAVRAGRVVKDMVRDQSGNIFFTLFGAVALVGVIGAGMTQIMRGPVTTMAEVTRRTIAENNMIAGTRLAIITSTTTADGGDCDGDGYIEPVMPRDPGGGDAPTGGGWLPLTIAISKLDPWQNEYGYCVWDHGAVTVSDADPACTVGAGESPRLEGGPPVDANDEYVLAIISSGPDRVFQTTCNDWVDTTPADGEPDTPLLVKLAGSDDLVMGHTYDGASALGGGLWTLKVSEPGTAEIEKDLEVTGSLSFLEQGSGLVLPGDPGDDTLTGACSAVNDQQLRRNTSTSPPTIELCDFGGSGTWESARGLGLWKSSGSDVYYDDGNVAVNGGTNFEYWFNNTNDTTAGIDTAWRLVANDGTGNFHKYINSTGGSSPVYETDGRALHEWFNPGSSSYQFEGAADGTAGAAITWQDILALDLDNARVGIGGITSPDLSLEVGGSGIRSTGAVSETAAGIDRFDLGVFSGSPRMILEDDASATIWEMDNTAGTLRFFNPGAVKMTLDSGGNLTTTGDIRAQSGIYRGAESNEYIEFRGSDDSIRFFTQNNQRAMIANSGELNVTGAITAPEGTLRDDGGGWVRTYGNTGWYNGTHGGGWYMTDNSYLRAYNNKNVYTPGTIYGGNIRTSNFSGGRWCKANSSGVIVCNQSAPSASPSCTTRSATNGGNDSSQAKACNSGETMTGGGCNCSGTGGFSVKRSYPSASKTWTCKCGGGSDSTTVYVRCCTF